MGARSAPDARAPAQTEWSFSGSRSRSLRAEPARRGREGLREGLFLYADTNWPPTAPRAITRGMARTPQQPPSPENDPRGLSSENRPPTAAIPGGGGGSLGRGSLYGNSPRLPRPSPVPSSPPVAAHVVSSTTHYRRKVPAMLSLFFTPLHYLPASPSLFGCSV